MRLWLSDKAARAMKNLPPEDYVTCEQHGKQRYGRTPKELEQEKGTWLCSECLKALESQQGAQRDEKRRKEDEEREARKVAKKAARDATGTADDELAETLRVCKDMNRGVRELQHRLRERRKDLQHGPAAIAEAEERLRAAQAALEAARRGLARAEQEVPALETQLGGEREALNGKVAGLEKALDEADAAWKGVPPRNRKKRDRRTRHAAVQIVLANRRWRERQAEGGTILPEDGPDLEILSAADAAELEAANSAAQADDLRESGASEALGASGEGPVEGQPPAPQ